MTDIEQTLQNLPTETIIRAAIIKGIGMAGEIAAAFDRIATAQERQADALERLAQAEEDQI